MRAGRSNVTHLSVPVTGTWNKRCYNPSQRIFGEDPEKRANRAFMFPFPKHDNGDNVDSTGVQKIGSCAALLVFTVSATIFTEASKAKDGSYRYNTFMIPCAVEALKFFISALLLLRAKARGEIQGANFGFRKFATFALPAMCYFVSNNCMFYIIQELGPTTFQITNNLKVLATGVLMRIFLRRELTWLRWKALFLLVLGSCVTQLQREETSEKKNSRLGYVLVLVNSFSSGAGGVVSELLLKGTRVEKADSIHVQNMQLYFFGILFGLASSWSKIVQNGAFTGFNIWACAAIISLTLVGLLVSFILKYLDNFAKCFVAAVAIVCVALIQGVLHQEGPRLNLVIGVILTCLALEQYHLPQ